jgi:hypothetical protein
VGPAAGAIGGLAAAAELSDNVAIGDASFATVAIGVASSFLGSAGAGAASTAAVTVGTAGVKVGAPSRALDARSVGGFSCATTDGLGFSGGGAAEVSVVPVSAGSGAFAKNVARKQVEPASHVKSEVKLSAV